MEDLIMKRIEKADTATAKCPECGGKYVKATKYCPSCKKKVKESEKSKEENRSKLMKITKKEFKALHASGSLNLVQGGINKTAEEVVNRLTEMDASEIAGIKGRPVSRMDVGSQSSTGYDVAVFSINIFGREFIIVEETHDASIDKYVSWDTIDYYSTVYLNNKVSEKNIIELPEDVTIDMGDREVILEKGDRIKVIGKVEENWSDMYQRGYDDATIGFSYIPDFKNDKEKKEYERGLKDGYANRKQERILEASGLTKLSNFWRELKKLQPKGTIHSTDRPPADQYFSYSADSAFQHGLYQIYYQGGEVKKIRVSTRDEEVISSVEVIESGEWTADSPRNLAKALLMEK